MRATVVLLAAALTAAGFGYGTATGTGAKQNVAAVAPSALPPNLYAVRTFTQLRPTVFVPVLALSADRNERATYAEVKTGAAIALLRRLHHAAGYWSAAYPRRCPAHPLLEGESGSGMGALALADCGHPNIVLVEWHGATKLGVVPLSEGGPIHHSPSPEYIGNVAFFFDDLTTGKAIGGFLAEVPGGFVALSSLGPSSSVVLPSRALPVQHPNGVQPKPL